MHHGRSDVPLLGPKRSSVGFASMLSSSSLYGSPRDGMRWYGSDAFRNFRSVIRGSSGDLVPNIEPELLRASSFPIGAHVLLTQRSSSRADAEHNSRVA